MPPTIKPEVLQQIQYGVFIVTSALAGKHNGQIATVVFQVTSHPIQIATCLHKDNLTHHFTLASKTFGIAILSQTADLKFIGQFGFRSGHNCDKFAAIKYKQLITGAPLVLDNAASILDLQVNQTLDVGTHTLFIGEVVAAEQLNATLPMTYTYYHNVIKGKTHKHAPTYQIANYKQEE